MPHTYTQIYLHIIFAVSGRLNLIKPDIEDELYRYMAGVVRGKHQTLVALNGMPDHVHLLVGMKPDKAVSSLVHDVKIASTTFVNSKGWFGGKYAWQEGYGAFSYSRSQLDQVAQYIRDQKKHHADRSFRNEYLLLLEKFQVAYEDQYLFQWIE